MRFYIIMLIALGLLATPVFAQVNDTLINTTDVNVTANVTDTNLTNITAVNVAVNENEVGALPGDFTYGFQRFFENVDKFFTFNKAEKAKKHARYGKLRSIEAHLLTRKAQQYMADNNIAGADNTLELAKAILADYEQESIDAQELIEEAVEEGSANETDVEEVQVQLRNSIVVLQRVYEKVPDSAKPGIARALNNSIANQERHEEKMQEKFQNKLAKQGGAAIVTDVNETESNVTAETNTTGKPLKSGKAFGKTENQTDSEDEDEEDENETEENETASSSPGNGKGKNA